MKLLVHNPYDWNTITLKKNRDTRTPSVNETSLDKDFMLVGKFLGLDGKPDFQKYQDKLRDIILWGIEHAQSHDLSTVVDVLKEKLNSCPAMSARRIDDLWIGIKLETSRQDKQGFKNNYQEEVK